VPGARLCGELEWERAARGADGRQFSHGDALVSGQANFLGSYGGDAAQMGADEVGAFALDESPFGVRDLTGNVAEWVLDNLNASDSAQRVVRGGYWLHEAIRARAAHRRLLIGRSTSTIGLRVCAPAPAGF
jgi:formylglycine-generating enzyme required for sulfatase activity